MEEEIELVNHLKGYVSLRGATFYAALGRIFYYLKGCLEDSLVETRGYYVEGFNWYKF